MKRYRSLLTILAIIMMACLFGVQAQFQQQYATPSIAYSTTPSIAQPAPSASQDPLQYSQFYTMTSGIAPSSPIGAPQQAMIAGNVPTTVYLGQQMQSVPYSQYQSYPVYTGANSLWIKGATAWTQYAVVPQGATLSLFVISPIGGSGSLNFVDADGQTYSQNYLFFPNSLITFYAYKPGRFTLSFAINGQSSNQVVINVVGTTNTQPSNYPLYYPGNYQGYYPESYSMNYYLANYYPFDYSSTYHHQGHRNDHEQYAENGARAPAQVQCQPAYHAENGACVPDQYVPCTSNDHIENGICVGGGNVQCYPNYHLDNGVCVHNGT